MPMVMFGRTVRVARRSSGAPTFAQPFIWDAVTGATSFVLQVGRTTTASDVFNEDVGLVRTYELQLPHGTYFSRVVPQGAGSTTDEQTFTI